MKDIFSHAPIVRLPIANKSDYFPVRRIYCVGRNYTEHVREMGGDVERSEPTIFTKDATTIVQNDSEISYPPNTDNLHYEVELVVAIGPDGIFGYAVGIDMTRRDLQAAAKKKGGPWDRAKNFSQSAPCSAITPADNWDVDNKHIVLRKNGDIVQYSRLDKMIWTTPEIIERISEDMDLKPGDLIFTGTPAGVGPVIAGDELEGGIEGLAPIRVRFI